MAKPQIKMGTKLTDYHQVKMAPSVMLSKFASVIGDVALAEDVAVFAGSHIRGDCAPISVGAGSNIQENACLHVSVGCPLTVGANVTVGHGAILHGCTIEDNVLVGMGAIVMDDAHIGRDCVIGAGALVTQGKQFAPRSLIMGSPAKAVRELTDEEIDSMVTVAGAAYVDVARAMLEEGLMANPPENAHIWPVDERK